MVDLLQRPLAFLYGAERASALASRLSNTLRTFQAANPNLSAAVNGESRFDERDSILITYGDMVLTEGQSPLRSLANFLADHLSETISTVHLLPFFPSSSDDGFSVIDYYKVDPALGSWSDIAHIDRSFRLMFDAVVNHVSSHSDWFQRFLTNDPIYRDYFIAVDSGVELSGVFRPRALPLTTEVQTSEGVKQVWTTFSADQVDLNFANPDVLFSIIDVLLFYVGKGAEFIRLDAVAFLWKIPGTACIHLPQTHVIIQLMRMVLDLVAPRIALISETNVPHEQNISYFGNGSNEAQLVYNFSLPPLTLHAFLTGDARQLSEWADGLTAPSDQATFFNFLASHDGIGLTPARGLLTEAEILRMSRHAEDVGGYVAYRSNSDGSQSPYELNVNYMDAMASPQDGQDSNDILARRFIASQAVMLALRGVPGIYFHSLFGSRGWQQGVNQTGRARTVNREKLNRTQLESELEQPHSLRRQVLDRYRRLLLVRAAEPAFHPNASQEVLDLHPAVLALRRTSLDAARSVICLHNVSSKTIRLSLPRTGRPLTNLLDGTTEIMTQLELRPYQVMWLRER